MQQFSSTLIAVTGGILLAWMPDLRAENASVAKPPRAITDTTAVIRNFAAPVQQSQSGVPVTPPVSKDAPQSISDRGDARLPAVISANVLSRMKEAACLSDAIPDEAILKVELNADRILDYVINYASIPCTDVSLGQALKECGTGGCTVETWISGNGSWRLVSSDVLRGIKKGKSRGDRDTLIIATNGTACDQIDFKSCFFQVWWNGKIFAGELIEGRKCAANEKSWECESSRE